MGAIYRREIGAYFTSSIAYIFLAVFWTFSGWFFYAASLTAGTTDMSGMFQSLFLVIIFLIPILTMRLFSEEKKQKTEQGLLTAPVSLGEIVFGKYFAALTLYTIAILMPFVYAMIMSSFGHVEWGIVFANFLALFLLGAAFIAVGTLISALTENQIAAAVMSFVALMALYMLDLVGGLINIVWVQNLLKSLSFYTKYYSVTVGLFNVSTVVFYLSVAFIFNYLTIRVFERRRWS
ncbi:MAG: ABC transporter permease [Oscillospiraceae bacterium]|nr:ABC transporter permease [Oscillospiraceae bacterium]MCR5306642.1 ABC transporter permease [Oscillospiraceae bacterium]